MPKVERSLSVERILDSQEVKKDAEILSKVSSDLPSAAKIKIFKKEDENKIFISSISADDFIDVDPHEFIKSKYSKRHGGGEYLIELLDSNGRTVDKRVINISSDKESDEKSRDDILNISKITKDAMEMREESFGKLKEAQNEKLDAERIKFETIITSMNKQWETIQKMYEKQIEVLSEQKTSTQDPHLQTLIQMQIDNVRRDMGSERERFESEIRSNSESKVATEKMFDLVNTLIPLIINKSTSENKDPINELTKTMTLIENVTGKKKDIIESFIENPERMAIFQKMLGVETTNKKDFFSDMFENPAKIEFFKKMMGIDEKKDFFSEMVENPIKFEMFKKLTGIDRQEETMRSMYNAIESMSLKNIEPERPKGFFDELVETSQKLEAAKPILKNILGIQSQPAKTFMELISTVLTNAGPYLAQSIDSVMKGMITIEMVKKGMVKAENMQGFAGLQTAEEPVRHKKQPVKQHTEKPATENLNMEEEMSIDDKFKEIITNILIKHNGVIDTTDFINMVSTEIVNASRKNPMYILQIMKYGSEEKIIDKVKEIFMGIMGTDENTSLEISKQVVNNVINIIKTA